MSLSPALKSSIALTRFGLGARPGEISAAAGDPEGYLKAQIQAAGAEQPQADLPSARQGVEAYGQFTQLRKEAKQDGDPKNASVRDDRKAIRDTVGADFLARMQLATSTQDGFRERWALFWFNHFTVSDSKAAAATVIGPFEREAIRPRVFGRFADLLAASTAHPAMLIYLDQVRSIGPDSLAASKAAGRNIGLNENLAREILELHTLGVGSGYTQADVTEFARALTGWSIIGPNPPMGGGRFAVSGEPGDFVFRTAAHEPGRRRVLGRTYAEDGVDQAAAVLRDLAVHPATARHIAVKIARHFVAEDPPPGLVARLERTFITTDGRLDAVAAALIASPEAWAPEPRKFKTPYEFLVSSYRACGQAPGDVIPVGQTLNGMGQKPFGAPSPKGWAEETETWASPDAIIKRMVWAEGFAAASTPADMPPLQIAQNALGARLSAAVSTTVTRAESRPEAFSILLMSPEFQRR